MLIDHQTSQLTKKSSFLIRLNCSSVIRLSIYRIPRNGLHSEAGLNVNELMRFTWDLPLIDPYEMARRGVSERVLQIPQDSDLGAIKCEISSSSAKRGVHFEIHYRRATHSSLLRANRGAFRKLRIFLAGGFNDSRELMKLHTCRTIWKN